MSDITLKATQSTPEVASHWETGILEMRGDSYPENSFEFFGPIVSWIQDFLHTTTLPLHLELHLLYLNTSSVKVMMDVFDLLEDAGTQGREVGVRWYYQDGNERIAELAEEFKEDCTFPFEVCKGND